MAQLLPLCPPGTDGDNPGDNPGQGSTWLCHLGVAERAAAAKTNLAAFRRALCSRSGVSELQLEELIQQLVNPHC